MKPYKPTIKICTAIILLLLAAPASSQLVWEDSLGFEIYRTGVWRPEKMPGILVIDLAVVMPENGYIYARPRYDGPGNASLRIKFGDSAWYEDERIILQDPGGNYRDTRGGGFSINESSVYRWYDNGPPCVVLAVWLRTTKFYTRMTPIAGIELPGFDFAVVGKEE